ncbi:MAG: hypothetical protein KA712_08320 [Myxococcales bacterium]|nr:hypothetical protein [Myxococcales bacterium]
MSFKVSLLAGSFELRRPTYPGEESALYLDAGHHALEQAIEDEVRCHTGAAWDLLDALGAFSVQVVSAPGAMVSVFMEALRWGRLVLVREGHVPAATPSDRIWGAYDAFIAVLGREFTIGMRAHRLVSRESAVRLRRDADYDVVPASEARTIVSSAVRARRNCLPDPVLSLLTKSIVDLRAPAGSSQGAFVLLRAPASRAKGFGSRESAITPARLKELKEQHERETFASDLPLVQFRGVAQLFCEDAFVAWSIQHFGGDVSLAAHRRLYRLAKAGSLTRPAIELAGGASGSYDNETRTVYLDPALVNAAADGDNESAWLLLRVLIHEFGHHIDNVLRQDLEKEATGTPAAKTDAEGEEGVRFTYALLNLRYDGREEASIGIYTRRGASRDVKVKFKELNQALKALPKGDDDESVSLSRIEYFEAGRGKGVVGHSYGHQSIEDALRKTFDQPGDIENIYFGNWLRDYSQFLDPKWIAGKGVHRFGSAGPALFPLIPRAFVTRYVAGLAQEEFKSIPDAFEATLKGVGVYRPEEHIDNPKGCIDGTGIDPDFRGPVIPYEIEVDPRAMMKNYIHGGPFGGIATAKGHMTLQLKAAASAGRSEKGLRHLGSALHTLEDLFAHSNYIELALHVGGFAGINLWTAMTPERFYPLVTGTFGTLDMAPSILLPLANALVAHPRQVLSFPALEILEANAPWWKRVLDALGRQQIRQAQLAQEQGVALTNLIVQGLVQMMRGTVAVVEAAEEAFFGDETSTDPTHSLLAKDHSDHPLHELSAEVAKLAISDVGDAIDQAWDSEDGDPDTVVTAATKFLAHPALAAAQAGTPRRIIEAIWTWAEKNPAALRRLSKQGSKEERREHAQTERRKVTVEIAALLLDQARQDQFTRLGAPEIEKRMRGHA